MPRIREIVTEEWYSRLRGLNERALERFINENKEVGGDRACLPLFIYALDKDVLPDAEYEIIESNRQSIAEVWIPLVERERRTDAWHDYYDDREDIKQVAFILLLYHVRKFFEKGNGMNYWDVLGGGNPGQRALSTFHAVWGATAFDFEWKLLNGDRGKIMSGYYEIIFFEPFLRDIGAHDEQGNSLDFMDFFRYHIPFLSGDDKQGGASLRFKVNANVCDLLEEDGSDEDNVLFCSDSSWEGLLGLSDDELRKHAEDVAERLIANQLDEMGDLPERRPDKRLRPIVTDSPYLHALLRRAPMEYFLSLQALRSSDDNKKEAVGRWKWLASLWGRGKCAVLNCILAKRGDDERIVFKVSGAELKFGGQKYPCGSVIAALNPDKIRSRRNEMDPMPVVVCGNFAEPQLFFRPQNRRSAKRLEPRSEQEGADIATWGELILVTSGERPGIGISDGLVQPNVTERRVLNDGMNVRAYAVAANTEWFRDRETVTIDIGDRRIVWNKPQSLFIDPKWLVDDIREWSGNYRARLVRDGCVVKNCEKFSILRGSTPTENGKEVTMRCSNGSLLERYTFKHDTRRWDFIVVRDRDFGYIKPAWCHALDLSPEEQRTVVKRLDRDRRSELLVFRPGNRSFRNPDGQLLLLSRDLRYGLACWETEKRDQYRFDCISDFSSLRQWGSIREFTPRLPSEEYGHLDGWWVWIRSGKGYGDVRVPKGTDDILSMLIKLDIPLNARIQIGYLFKEEWFDMFSGVYRPENVVGLSQKDGRAVVYAPPTAREKDDCIIGFGEHEYRLSDLFEGENGYTAPLPTDDLRLEDGLVCCKVGFRGEEYAILSLPQELSAVCSSPVLLFHKRGDSWRSIGNVVRQLIVWSLRPEEKQTLCCITDVEQLDRAELVRLISPDDTGRFRVIVRRRNAPETTIEVAPGKKICDYIQDAGISAGEEIVVYVEQKVNVYREDSPGECVSVNVKFFKGVFYPKDVVLIPDPRKTGVRVYRHHSVDTTGYYIRVFDGTERIFQKELTGIEFESSLAKCCIPTLRTVKGAVCCLYDREGREKGRIAQDLEPNGPEYERMRSAYERERELVEIGGDGQAVPGGALVCWESNEGNRRLCCLRRSSDLREWNKLRFIDSPTGEKAELFIMIGDVYRSKIEHNGEVIEAAEPLTEKTGGQRGVRIRLLFLYGKEEFVLMDISSWEPADAGIADKNECEIGHRWRQFVADDCVRALLPEIPSVMVRRDDGTLVLIRPLALGQMDDLICRNVSMPDRMEQEIPAGIETERGEMMRTLKNARDKVILPIGPMGRDPEEYGSFRFLKNIVSRLYNKETSEALFRARALGLGMLRLLCTDERYQQILLEQDWSREVSEDAIRAGAAIFCALTQKFPSPVKNGDKNA